MIKSIFLFALFASLLNAQAPIPFTFAIFGTGNAISLYSTASSTALATAQISGVPAGVSILSATLRPSAASVYALGSDNALYTLAVNLATSSISATKNVTITGCTLDATLVYAIDVNPVADALRVVSNNNSNWRINFATGACTVDTPIFYINTSSIATVGVAYTNNVFPAPTATREYILDGELNAYAVVNTPNAGNASVLTALNLDVSATSVSPLDFVNYNGVDYGFALISGSLYTINPNGSGFTLVRAYGNGVGLVVFPNGFFPVATTTTTTTGTNSTTSTTSTTRGATSTTGGAGSGSTTTTGETSSAASVVASALLIVAFLAMLF